MSGRRAGVLALMVALSFLLALLDLTILLLII